MNEFFDEAAAAFADVAQQHGATIEPPKLDPKMADELLQLSRIVSHTRERRFAPLFCYVAGIAAARLQAVRPKTDVIEYLEAVRAKLALQEDSTSAGG